METLRSDLVIIGAGATGLRAAITAQTQLKRIVVLNKGPLFASGSTFNNRNNQWGITFATSDRQGEELLRTINTISGGTNDPGLSRILVDESRQAYQDLRDLGVRFTSDSQGKLLRIPPCFHPQPLAAVITSCDQAGRAFASRLDHSRLLLLEHTRVRQLLIHDNTIRGLLASSRLKTFKIDTPTILLATGGDSAVFTPNIVEPGLTGDGYNLLKEAGIPLSNMEYRQRVWEDVDRRKPRFSVSSLWEGRHVFRTAEGEPLDIPTPEEVTRIGRNNHVPISNLQNDRYIDELLIRHITSNPASAIQVYRRGEDQPCHHIYPHVQACNGGVKISAHGETGINGLFAAGEVTTGMHGGDRVGGMMITATQVFGRRAALAAVNYLRST